MRTTVKYCRPDSNYGAVISNGARIVAMPSQEKAEFAPLVYSDDGGETWHEGPALSIHCHIYSGAHFNGVWIAAGQGAGYLWRSTDGVNWSPVYLPDHPAGSTFYAECYGVSHDGTRWYVVTTQADGGLYVSTDGASWSKVFTPGAKVQGMAHALGTHVMVGDHAAYHSTDGSSWQQVSLFGGGRGVVHDGTWYIAAGLSGTAWYGNSAAWTPVTFGQGDAADIVLLNGGAVIITESGRAYRSDDHGVTWHELSSNNLFSFTNVCSAAGKLIISGGYGTVQIADNGEIPAQEAVSIISPAANTRYLKGASLTSEWTVGVMTMLAIEVPGVGRFIKSGLTNSGTATWQVYVEGTADVPCNINIVDKYGRTLASRPIIVSPVGSGTVITPPPDPDPNPQPNSDVSKILATISNQLTELKFAYSSDIASLKEQLNAIGTVCSDNTSAVSDKIDRAFNAWHTEWSNVTNNDIIAKLDKLVVVQPTAKLHNGTFKLGPFGGTWVQTGE
jgi:hypothetical protein